MNQAQQLGLTALVGLGWVVTHVLSLNETELAALHSARLVEFGLQGDTPVVRPTELGECAAVARRVGNVVIAPVGDCEAMIVSYGLGESGQFTYVWWLHGEGYATVKGDAINELEAWRKISHALAERVVVDEAK